MRAVIALSNVSKSFGRQALLTDASFQLDLCERVGLVGPNGAGKSTLFRLIVGEEAGRRRRERAEEALHRVLPPDAAEGGGGSVLDEAIVGSGRLGELHREVAALEEAMADPEQADRMDAIPERFGEVQGEHAQLGGYELESKAREVLAGLGFLAGAGGGADGRAVRRMEACGSPSRVLIGRPDVLLLDEPTNHLDIESILWLEQFLAGVEATLLMTCHDRDFMNRVVGRIVEIDGGELVSYSGDYDFYDGQRAVRAKQQGAAFARQQAMLKKEERFIERFEKHAAKAAQVQSRVKKLDKIEKLEPPKKRVLVPFRVGRRRARGTTSRP